MRKQDFGPGMLRSIWETHGAQVWRARRDCVAAPPAAGAPRSSLNSSSLLLLAAAVGLVVSLASWCFLQFVHYLPEWVYEDLPERWVMRMGRHCGGTSRFARSQAWWSPLRSCDCRVTGATSPPRASTPAATEPIDLPGVMLAALATIGLGLVLGPEAPLLALGGGLAILAIRLVRKDAPDDSWG